MFIELNAKFVDRSFWSETGVSLRWSEKACQLAGATSMSLPAERLLRCCLKFRYERAV